MFHGQGRGSDADDKQETDQFFRRLDDGVVRLLVDKGTPLVIAAVGYEVAMYKSISKHPRIVEPAVEGNTDHLSAEELHERALAAASDAIEAFAARRGPTFAQGAHSARALVGLQSVLPAVRAGRVGMLFARPEDPVWGTYNEDSGIVEVHDERRPDDDDLLDLAISLAARSGAELSTADDGQISAHQRLAAISRY